MSPWALDTMTRRVFSRPVLETKCNVVANTVKHLPKYLRAEEFTWPSIYHFGSAQLPPVLTHPYCLTRGSRGHPGPRIQHSDPLSCATPKPTWGVQCRSGQWKPSKGVQGRPRPDSRGSSGVAALPAAKETGVYTRGHPYGRWGWLKHLSLSSGEVRCQGTVICRSLISLSWQWVL